MFNSVYIQQPLVSASRHRPARQLAGIVWCQELCWYLIVGIFVFVSVITGVVILIILIFFKVLLVELFIELLELKRFAREPVDSTRDQLFLDVLTELVVELEAFLNIG